MDASKKGFFGCLGTIFVMGLFLYFGFSVSLVGTMSFVGILSAIAVLLEFNNLRIKKSLEINLSRFIEDMKGNVNNVSLVLKNGKSGKNNTIKIEVDKLKQVIRVNNNFVLTPNEFAYRIDSITEMKGGSIGHATGTVSGNSVVITSVTPGYSGNAEKVGVNLIILQNGKELAKLQFSFLSFGEHFDNVLSNALDTVVAYCKNILDKSAYEKNALAQDKVQNILDKLQLASGVDQDCFKKIRIDDAGMLHEAIAVDRSGKAFAVYNNGKSTWTGTLKGASASINDKNQYLEVMVDDPAYREKNLAELRFHVAFYPAPKKELDEWKDRINLLAKKLA
jgi:hypothetical protein